MPARSNGHLELVRFTTKVVASERRGENGRTCTDKEAYMVESSAPITAFFDVGGVIVNSHPSAQHIASLIGDGRQSLVNFVDQAMWAHRDGYDAGVSDRDFWDRVAGDCGKPAVTDELLETLVEYDSMRVHQPVPETIELLKDLHAQGIRLGILSNAPRPIANEIRRTQWAQYFESFTFSCDTACCKPDRPIYRAALEAMGIEAKEAVFFDDRKKNIRAAELLGIRGIMWTNAEHARRDRSDLGKLA